MAWFLFLLGKSKLMGDVKNLANNEALEKIKDLIDGKMCLFCNIKDDGSIDSRPMSIAQIDDEGAIWFFSPKDSDKNKEIARNSKVYLMYMEAGKQHYLSLTANAEIVFDQAKVEELWNVFLKAWFTGGKDDPNISLLRVIPDEGHYWDEKNGRFISFIKTGIAALTGTKGLDGSLEGDLRV
jgi:general stress protein 26